MSRVTKWKLDKTKVKVVFRLQFHATHIPSSGWEKLFISFIPTESGKTTAKTTKANVRNGTCKWADPIYETTRLLQDAKSKQYDEKLYKLVVAMGSSRSSILGETIINLADYADALKPSDVAMPLHGCNSGTILHVTLQLLTSKTGFREFEQQRELRERGLQMGTDSNRHDESGNNKVPSSEATVTNQMDKVNPKVRFRSESKELPSPEEGLNEESVDSAVGFDGSSNTSEILYGEKNDSSSTHEIDSLKSTVSGDLNVLSHCQSPRTQKGDSSDHQFLEQGRSDWIQGWGSDYSVDNDLAIVYEENSKLRGNLEVAESSIYELKLEVSSLQNHADELGIETQSIASQLAIEIASGEELAKEISSLKSECLTFKGDLERLKNDKVVSEVTSKVSSRSKLDHLLQDKQLRWLKGLSAVEDRIKELQRKAYLGFEERDFSFLQSDVEALLCTLQDLKQGTVPISILNLVSEQVNLKDIGDVNLHKREQFASGTGFDVELYQPESMLHYLSMPSLVSQETEYRGATDALESKTFELLRELDEAKVERESLARKMDQMECYYEALIHELEENQKQMLGELQNLRNEHSVCLYTISTKEAEMETMRQEMNEQIIRFAEERSNVDSLNKELERRVLTSEAALKRARLNYSIAVDQLQKDLELLSLQVLSMFETNENLIKQAFSETSQPCFQGYPDTVQNIEKFDLSKLSRCLNQNVGTQRQLLSGDILVEDMKKSLHLQEELYQKVEDELCDMHSANLYLDVLSKTLQETLLEANIGIRLMKEKLGDLTLQLELTVGSKDVLMAKLQAAMNDVQMLNEHKAISISKTIDMHLQNQISEAKLESVSMENFLLKQKILDCEVLIKEFKSYESKYEACFVEKSEVENLLKLEAIESENLRIELSSLKKELKSLRVGFDESAVMQKNLRKISSFLQDKLGSLLASYEKQFSGLTLLSTSWGLGSEYKDFEDVIVQLEEIQKNACERILQLMEEKNDVEEERDAANLSLTTFRMETLGMKQKFEHDIQEMVAKIDMSNALVEKLKKKLESVSNKFHTSSEVEDRYVQKNEELFAGLALMELQLQNLATNNKDLGQEILGLGTIAEELGRSKMTIAELIQEKQNLDFLLEAKTEEAVKLALDSGSLKERLRCLQDDLDVEKGFRDKLEGTITELGKSKMIVDDLFKEKQDLTMLLEDKFEESVKLAADLDIFKESLRSLQAEIHLEKGFRDKLKDTVTELGRSKMIIAELMKEKQDLTGLLESKTEESVKLASDLDSLKESLRCLQAELHVEKGMKGQLEGTVTELKRSQMTTAELMLGKQDLKMLEGKSEESVERTSDLDSLKESLRCLQDELHVEIGFRDKREGTVTELKRNKIIIAELIQEKQDLTMLLEDKTEESSKLASDLDSLRCLQDELESTATELRSKLDITKLIQEKQGLTRLLKGKTEESVKFASDLDSLKESLRCLQDELHVEKSFRDKLEGKVTELTHQLEDEKEKLFHLDPHNAELVRFRQLASDLEIEISREFYLSMQPEECLEELRKESSGVTGLKGQLSEMHEHIMAADVRLTFVRTQYETLTEELRLQLQSSHGDHIELQKKYLDIGEKLNRSLASEAHFREENADFVTNLRSLRSQLEASVTQSRVLSDSNNVVRAQLEEYKTRLVTLEDRLFQDKNQHDFEVEQFKDKVSSVEQEIDNLIFSKEELEILLIILKTMLDEQHARITLMEDSNNESMKLRIQFNELNRKLAEQILKTEEFKNLSVHLKELKDKAEAESHSAHEKRGPEGPPVAMQESLRIAFIKEQYETRLQEMKQQLSISKKHGEEMLLKLQDVVDETENRKKSEASHLKRNEELSIKILELEAELQSVLSDKREKIKAYDRINTELDCTLLSLECCKEEKEKLEASLQECEEEKSKIAAELTLRRGQLDNSTSSMGIQKEENGEKARHLSGNLIHGKTNHAKIVAGTSSLDRDKVLDTSSITVSEAGCSLPMNKHSIQVVSKDVHGITEYALQANLTFSNTNHADDDHFQVQSLKSSMEHLHEELERMKMENSIFPQISYDPDLQDLERELEYLHKANEELGSIYPLFNEFPGSGNALERVLALEIELAEALRSKKKSSFHIQSAFLKQHGDEEAVFKSFRYINELIKDMLELKGRNAGVETELKDMHDRYSQLSLQFAEVEGERQRLMMTLKNIRTSKKLVSSSAILPDHPS